MRILINRYHPVSEDLAITFSKLYPNSVTLSVNTAINDHYGSWKAVYENIKSFYPEFKTITLQQALVMVKSKQFDLVVCDGVFDGDKLLMDVARQGGVPTANIQGYPYTQDEPAQNILSLGWFLPQVQYVNKYPNEYAVKMGDWKNIATAGSSAGKNICVFYPNFWRLIETLQRGPVLSTGTTQPDGYLSAIHRYEECNEWPYKVFCEVKEKIAPLSVTNLSGLKTEEIARRLILSRGVLMLKAFDQPGIFLFEALLCGAPIFTMKSYVLGSFNQDVLIDGFNACIADTVPELIERMKSYEYSEMSENAGNHARMLTSFERQQHKLKTFLENCR